MDERFQPGFISAKIPFADILLTSISVDCVEYWRCEGSDDEYQQERDERFTADEVRAMTTAIVALSRTDGAVVFDGNMHLVAAGAFLKVTSESKSRGGARRKSAESFVRSNPGSAVIVISQDGPVTVYA
jgi:DNA integrity scanning protein DisA with diadenylate cyclase activity